MRRVIAHPKHPVVPGQPGITGVPAGWQLEKLGQPARLGIDPRQRRPHTCVVKPHGGNDPSVGPDPGADSDQDGVSNAKEFLAGTDPTNPNSVLRARLSISALGRRLTWNTQPGLVYQVQSSSDLAAWANVGAPRFAAGSSDSLLVAGSGQSTYYRVIRNR